MSAADTDTDNSVWSIRGVPSALIEDVKAAARRENMNIGQFVSLSLRKFFDEYAQRPNTVEKISYVDEKIAEAEQRMSAEIEAKFAEFIRQHDHDQRPPTP